MTLTKPDNDNAPGLHEAPHIFYRLEEAGALAAGAEPHVIEGILTAAILSVAAFRLRDEEGLITSLRRLSDALDALERAA